MSKFNLVKKLRELFEKEKLPTPENKHRVKLVHKHREVRAQVFENDDWQTIKVIDLNIMSVEMAVQRAKAALEAYKALNIPEDGVINL